MVVPAAEEGAHQTINKRTVAVDAAIVDVDDVAARVEAAERLAVAVAVAVGLPIVSNAAEATAAEATAAEATVATTAIVIVITNAANDVQTSTPAVKKSSALTRESSNCTRKGTAS